MAENLEQKMNEVLSVGLPYIQMKSLVEQFEKTPTDYKVFENYKNFAFRELPQDVREASLKELEASGMYGIKRNMDGNLSRAEKELTERTSTNYDSIVKSADEDTLQRMAYDISGKEKDLKEVEAKIEARDFKSVREKYAETFKSAEWQDFIKNIARNEFVTTFAPMYFKYEHNNFARQFASTREVDGKQEAYLDKVKLVDYLNKKVTSAKDDKAKKKIFFQAGKSLSEHKLQELIQEQKEKAEAEKDKDKNKAA